MKRLCPVAVLVCTLALVGCTPETAPEPAETANSSGTIRVQVEGLRNTDGRLRVLLFNSSEGFPDSPEDALKSWSQRPGSTSIAVAWKSVPYGTYAVAVLHDENENNKMDRSTLGIPREGYGISQNPEPGFGGPQYEDAAFGLNSSEKKVQITMRYLQEEKYKKR